MLPSYVEAFWSEDFLSTAGYDVFCQRNQAGKRFCKDVEEYLKQRSKMELEYTKSLQSLAKTMKTKEDYGAELETAWNDLKAEVETMATIHSEASSFLSQQAEDVHRFKEEQMKERGQYESRMKSSQTQKINQHSKTMNAQKEYHKKCRDKDSAKETFDNLRHQVTTKTRDLDKAQAKLEKCTEDMKKADEAYKNNVDILDEFRVSWERDWKETCQALQRLDEERITYLRETMWRMVNVDSKLAVDVDETAERVRQALERVEPSQDMAAFQQKSEIGSKLPEPIVYINYYHPEQSARQRTPPQSARNNVPLPSIPASAPCVYDDDDMGLYSSVP